VLAGSGRIPDGDTLFEIGSITKVFTALLLADMALEGSVALDEPLRELLAGVRVPSRGGEICLEHLATHTSGLPRLPPGMLPRALFDTSNPYAQLDEDRVLAALERTRLRRAPGKRVRYSNLGPGLLGIALARRAGIGYEELLRSRVLEPLGLADTGIDVPPERLARGHSHRGRPVSWWDFPGLAGAGALRSSANDLLRLLSACLDPPDSRLGRALALAMKPRARAGRRLQIGLGWFQLRRGGETLVWHDGGTGGFRSIAGFVPTRRTAVVALTNSARPVHRVALRLGSALTGAG
jgi:CubicO group peptidase (beta-lactamase class C family)